MKKTLEYYMSLPYRLEIIPDADEGGYAARYPDLPGCLTFAESINDIISKAVDAKKEWLSAALENGMDIPEPKEESEYSGQFKLRMPKSLHKSLATHARLEGISMNQYCNYLLAMHDVEYNERKSGA